MTAARKDELIARRFGIPMADGNTLRRASLALSRWAEQECGDGNDYASWAIERDNTTGKPYRAVYPHNGPATRVPVADKETGALKRVAEVCRRNGLFYFHQTDPRGCALYVAREPLNATNYTRGFAVEA